MKTKDFVFVWIMCFILFMSSLYVFICEHEKVHQKIFEFYGYKSKVVFTMPWSAYTMPINSSIYNLTREEIFAMKDLHLQNEIAGYNIEAVVFGMFGYSTLIIFMMYLMSNQRHWETHNETTK